MNDMLHDIDAHLASRRKDLRLPPRVEALFDEDRRIHRAKSLRAVVLRAIICYNLFLPIDCYLLPATALISLGLHAVATMWILTAALILKRRRSLLVRETIGVTIPVAMVAQILTIAVLNDGVGAVQSYQYFVVMVLVYMNVNQRPDFFFAAWTSLVLLVVYVAYLCTTDHDIGVRLVGATSMAAAAYLTLHANWRMERDTRYAFVMRLRDRLRREIAEQEADRDTLTGLYNRRFFASRAGLSWADAASPKVAVAMVDVDHFKDYNDRYGHPAGDLCLKRVAAAIQDQICAETDVVARYGGEEFIVLLPGADETAAALVAERIRRAIAAAAIPHAMIGAEGRVTVSVGTAVGSTETLSIEELVSAADAALYAAKRNGRNRCWPSFLDTHANVTFLRHQDQPSCA